MVEPSLSVRPDGNGNSSGPGVAEVVNVRLPSPVTGSTVIEPTLVPSIVTGRSTGFVPSVGTFSTLIVSFWTTAPFSTTYWNVATAVSPAVPVISTIND